MPATTPEAIKTKADRRRNRRRAESAAKRAKIKKTDLPSYKIMMRRMMPRLPEMSKTELRAMLTAAVANTGSM